MLIFYNKFLTSSKNIYYRLNSKNIIFIKKKLDFLTI